MFFRPFRAGGDKRKRAKGRADKPVKPVKPAKPDRGNQAAGKPAPKPAPKPANTPRRRAQRLDSAVPLLRPPAGGRAPARLPERGAPLSDATQWLLERMRRLKNLDDYAALKQPFIERYVRDPRHSPSSAERAFYQAVGVCIRRVLEERAQRR